MDTRLATGTSTNLVSRLVSLRRIVWVSRRQGRSREQSRLLLRHGRPGQRLCPLYCSTPHSFRLWLDLSVFRPFGTSLILPWSSARSVLSHRSRDGEPLLNGQSCKLIPVLLLNVVLYRRRFSPHKYLVVALVTVGISMFMFFGPAKKKGGSDSTWGLTLLLIKSVHPSHVIGFVGSGANDLAC